MSRLLGLVLIVVVAVGCRSGETSSPTSESERSGTVVGPAEVADAPSFADPSGAAATSGEPLDEDYRLALSPIEQALGLPDDPFEISDSLKEHNRAVADAVTACMAAEGFGGFVEVPELAPQASDLADFSSTQAVASFGYGPAITLRSMLDQLDGPGSQLQTDGDAVPSGERNWENFDPISAFLVANPQIDEDDFYGRYAACFDQARADLPAPQIAVPEVVAKEIYEVRSDAAQTPGVVEAWDLWSKCLAVEGHSYITRVSVRVDMEDRGDPIRTEIVGYLEAGSVPEEADRVDLERRVEELADFERLVAGTDVACAQSTGLDATLQSERDRVELLWLDANEDRITLLLAEAAAAGPEDTDPRPSPADG